MVALIFARARRRRVRNGKCTRSSGVVGGDIEPQDRGTNMRTGTVVSYSVEKGWGSFGLTMATARICSCTYRTFAAAQGLIWCPARA